MYQRILKKELVRSIQQYPVVTILGPRQSGKTTLARSVFSDFHYISLEDPDLRAFATEDPRGFLESATSQVILDEIQRVPALTSYIQTLVDAPDSHRKFILTGSNSTLLTDSVAQTLAGRTELFTLLPLSHPEIRLANIEIKDDLNRLLFTGGYPRIFDQELDPTKWLKSYFQLYVEKDIRMIANIRQLDLFEKVVHLLAGRVGQLLNYSSIANESGVSSPTIKEWVSAMKSTFVCFTLMPHHKNFNKRVIKTPKIYFYDTGLLCYLLGINDPSQLDHHPLRGNIFENFMISEALKAKLNRGEESNYYFWRDQKGHEVDLVEDRAGALFPVEIKMSATFNGVFVRNIEYLNGLQRSDIEQSAVQGEVIYRGDREFVYKNIAVKSWNSKDRR